jgi:DNA replication protein DnaC
MTNIEETLKKIAAGTSKASSPTSSSIEPLENTLPGDPNCPICHGVGWIRQDLPLSHPDFGRLSLCSCRQKDAVAATFNRLYRLSNLEAFNSMTFENFKVQGRLGLSDDQVMSLKSALSQSTLFSNELKGWILFSGGYGCGKTHLAAAIANHAVGLGVPTLFLTVPDLLDWLRFAYDSPDSSFEERFTEIRNIRLLVLDDLGTQNTTPWAQEKLFQIINHRYIHHLATVVTTNQPLDEIDGRIRSRLEDPDLVALIRITAPDFRAPMRDSSHPMLSSLHLHTGRTFGNFSLRDMDKLDPEQKRSLERAFQAAQKFAEKPRGWLVLIGKYGTGKTHLAAAIGNYRHGLGETPMFVVVPDLLDHLRATFSPSSNISYDDLFNQVKTATLLILDDLGTQSATPWAREKLYQIFNYRYNAELPTVITTSMTLEEIDPRIQSRMLDTRMCTTLAIIAPPFRGAATPEKTRRPRKTGS